MTDDEQDLADIARALFAKAEAESTEATRITLSQTEDDEKLRDFAARLFGHNTDDN